MSPLFERLCGDLEQTRDPELRAVIGARIACLEARRGDFQEARSRIEAIRTTFGDGRSGRVTVWLMVAEGLAHHYEKFGSEARDRMTRAQILSTAMKYREVASLSSAWMAHFHFESGDYASMERAVASAFEYFEGDNHDANARLAAVLSNAFMIVGNLEESRRWFTYSKEQATRQGDRAMVEALLYNRSAFLITWARAENCIEPIDAEILQSIRSELKSTRNFQALTRIATLPEHVRLWNGRMLMLEGEFDAAMNELVAIRDEKRFASHNFSAEFVDLELVYCLKRVGRVDEALELYYSIPNKRFDQFDVDEQLVACWILLQLTSPDSRFGDSVVARSGFEAALLSYREVMSSLSSRIENFKFDVRLATTNQ